MRMNEKIRTYFLSENCFFVGNEAILLLSLTAAGITAGTVTPAP